MDPTTKAVFFDRDGTLNSDAGHYYIYREKDFRILPDVVESLRRLKEAGYLVFVVTNQGGIARGFYTGKDVECLHRILTKRVEEGGGKITRIYYCPHHESVEPCVCRKPSPYFINQAVEMYHIDRSASWMVGDQERDRQTGEAAGLHTIVVPRNGGISAAVNQILNTL